MSVRKARMPNLTEGEKVRLVELVEIHFYVVENKRTDSVTMEEKKKGWHVIADEFNSTSVVYTRSVDNLRLAWENLKKMAKRMYLQNKEEIFKTGGGVCKKRKADAILEKVTQLIKTQVKGFKNPYDSDLALLTPPPVSLGAEEPTAPSTIQETTASTFQETTASTLQETTDVEQLWTFLPEVEEQVGSTTPLNNGNWARFTPSQLRRPLHSALLTDEPGPCNSTFSNYSKRRPRVSGARQGTWHENFFKIKAEGLKKSQEETSCEHKMRQEMFAIDLEIKKEELNEKHLKIKLMEADLDLKKAELIEKNLKIKLLQLEVNIKEKI